VDQLTNLVPFKIREDPFEMSPSYGADVYIPSIMPSLGISEPPWWSRQRDVWLRKTVLNTDALKVAVKTYISKATMVPLRINPRDMSMESHMILARQMRDEVMRNSGFRKGFSYEWQKYLNDYLTQDNGAFMLILGRGFMDGPIVGRARGLIHLDTNRCSRTSDPVYPVVYTDRDGKRYKLHYTRIISQVSLPSPDILMNGVGLSPASVCVESATELRDIVRYFKEKLGSRPARQVLYAKTGATIDQLAAAKEIYERKMASEGLSFFSKTLLLAPKMPTGKLELEVLDLASAPDGFERQSVVMLGMANVAAAFGLDLRDMAHSFNIAGYTKADAEIQHLKGQGKGVAEIQDGFSKQLNMKYLPPVLVCAFDYVDDAQDEKRADIETKRSQSRARDLNSSAKTVRGVRQAMLRQGEVTDGEFLSMELENGRLPGGSDVLSLFGSSDAYFERALDLGVDDPLDLTGNDPEQMASLIRLALYDVWEDAEDAVTSDDRRVAQMAEAALGKLMGAYAMEANRVDASVAAVGNSGPNDPVDVGENSNPPDPGAGSPNPNDPAENAEKAVSIIPDGANDPLPPVPIDIPVTDKDVNRAIDEFEELFPDWAGLLDSDVTDLSKQKGRWTYDTASHRFRDMKNGRFVSERRIRSVMDRYESARKAQVDALTDDLVSGKINLKAWVSRMRDDIKRAYIVQYLAGRGGRGAMTQADWGRIGGLLRTQYLYLNRFATDMSVGGMSPGQIGARAKMYIDSSTQAFERAKVVGSRGMPALPAYPGDGTTQCLSNCKCRWVIKEKADVWEATWKLGQAEHCPDCIYRSAVWKPLVVSRM